ncbi:hypothetical protein JAAARDRAFT_200683 [Jaapia argillacea MUCL 33604]|uniref:Uncharacterized protein n=1 Tax=Jaapia argillacea MUCL 33604 TaxID=933084 RepID=A0A067PGL5_9AGAM|nr:hypothetical protein JAAARDRAFT_200683 [Jaapia argillacea MUCL 33604]
MSSTYSDNGYNGKSPLIMSLPDLVPSTTLLPPYGSSCKEDNNDFNSIYYNPPVEVKREPLSPRILTPLPPHIPTPITNYRTTCKTESLVTTSPSTLLTEPLTLENLWLGANFRASYNVVFHRPNVGTVTGSDMKNEIVLVLVSSDLVLTHVLQRNLVSPPLHCLIVPPIIPKPLTTSETHNLFPGFPLPLDPLSLSQHPHLVLGPLLLSFQPMSNQNLRPQYDARQGVQAALELWMSWAQMREQHLNITIRQDWPQVALVYRRAPPPPNQDLYIPQTINFDSPLPSNNIRATSSRIQLAEMPGPSWDEWNKFTGSQKLTFQEKYWA